ncbi:MAG TPA: hypothetical protein VNP04_13695 [Alphaproteobacteria bacterium]|nr:hypothetical protein [Alphaproteobacteria bacterium]
MRISQFLKEDNGVWSSARLIAHARAMAELFVWVYVSIQHGQMVDIPASAQTSLGIAVGGKVLQKFTEKPPNQP